MNTKMSQTTRQEVLVKKRERYAHAGKEHKAKIINELVELFGYQRKAASRALQLRPVIAAPFVLGRPKEYDPDNYAHHSTPSGWPHCNPAECGSRRACPTGCPLARRIIAASTTTCARRCWPPAAPRWTGC